MSITDRLKANQVERDELVNKYIDLSYGQGYREALRDVRAVIKDLDLYGEPLLEYIDCKISLANWRFANDVLD